MDSEMSFQGHRLHQLVSTIFIVLVTTPLDQGFFQAVLRPEFQALRFFSKEMGNLIKNFG